MKFSIVIPAYNEEENIAPLIDDIVSFGNKAGWDYEIIVVDDNSSDDTANIIHRYIDKYSFIKIIRRCSDNRGMGLALKDGTALAGSRIVVWMMADRADRIEIISDIIRKIEEGCDLVFASRYMPGGSRGDLDRIKAFLSSRYTVILRWLLGLKVHDVTNAFRGFRKDIFFKLKIDSTDFSISPEFAIKAHIAGYRLDEIPTTHKDRKAGRSKFKLFRMMLVYMRLIEISLRNP